MFDSAARRKKQSERVKYYCLEAWRGLASSRSCGSPPRGAWLLAARPSFLVCGLPVCFLGFACRV